MKLRKLFSLLASAAMTVFALTSVISASALEGEGQTYQGNADFIGSYLVSQYFGNTAFEVTFRYESFDPDGTYQDEETGEIKTIDYNDTFQFLVFDQLWQGWDKTIAGPQGVDVSQPPLTADDLSLGMDYTVTVDIATIESKLSTGFDPHGINLQLGGVGDTVVYVDTIRYAPGDVKEGEELTIVGNWKKFDGGTMEVVNGSAYVDANSENITVSNFSTRGFENPTVDVTVRYDKVPVKTAEANILTIDGKPIYPYFPNIDEAGTYTYTTELPLNITGLLAIYDYCTVQEIHVYNNHMGYAPHVSGKTASTINKNLQPGYTLGNALDAVNKDGEVDETAYGNPRVTEVTFQAIRRMGFKSVKIPITYLNMVNENGDINDDYLDRIQNVIDRALDTGLYVVINIHNDGGEGVRGKWIDISLQNGSAKFNAVVNKFSNMWSEIATRFKDYNQALVFEDMNEVRIDGVYDRNQLTDAQFNNAYANITELNQAFVNAVRGTGDDANDDRCLIVPGYGDNIDMTIDGFEENVFDMPNDTSADRQMLSVHYYTPSTFTLGGDYGDTNQWDMYGQYGMTYMVEQLGKIGRYGVPIYLGEYSAEFKNNIPTVANYVGVLNATAKYIEQVTGTSFSTSYWDNGVIGIDYTHGTGLINRMFNIITPTGYTISEAIVKNS